ncbi:MAG: endonuclease/exonuclease/phosphatase family protein, partial [Cyanobacteria bacterium J06582_2]
MHSVVQQLPRPFLLLGDFNAKHPLWDTINPTDQRGKIIEKLILEESLVVLNDGKPTHHHIQTNSFSTIDLSLCSVDAVGLFQAQTDTDLHGSDHFPLYLSSVEFLPQRGTPRWITKKANWPLFREVIIESDETRDDDPLIHYNKTIALIKEAASASIPKSDGHYNQCPVPWWNDRCETLKKERNRARRDMFRNPTTSNRVNYKRLRGLSQKTQKEAQKNSWKDYVSTINSNTECGQVWKKVN